MSFKDNETVCIVEDGQEIEVTFRGYVGSLQNTRMRAFVKLPDESERQVAVTDILKAKRPRFELRGLVYTMSIAFPNQQGEIVGMGRNVKGGLHYHVEFSNGQRQRFHEQDIFVAI